MKRYKVKFQYKDQWTRGNWSSQECTLSATDESDAKRKCIELYGLDECEYKITEVSEEN